MIAKTSIHNPAFCQLSIIMLSLHVGLTAVIVTTELSLRHQPTSYYDQKSSSLIPLYCSWSWDKFVNG